MRLQCEEFYKQIVAGSPEIDLYLELLHNFFNSNGNLIQAYECVACF